MVSYAQMTLRNVSAMTYDIKTPTASNDVTKWGGGGASGTNSSIERLLGDLGGVLSVLVVLIKAKAVPLHATEALGGRGGIAPTHSRPRY
jgi:hypothetical protein